MSLNTEPAGPPSTNKGRATRDRILAAAAELIYRHGVAGTSTPAIRDAAGVSSSQIYHYFSDKDDLTSAVIAYQSDAIMAAQAQLLAGADSLDALLRWRDLLVDTARRQHGLGGCPLGSLVSELADEHPRARALLSAGFDRWVDAIRLALTRLVENHTLDDELDIEHASLALLAAIQGGLLLAQTQHTTSALEAGLDTALDAVRAHATAAGQVNAGQTAIRPPSTGRIAP